MNFLKKKTPPKVLIIPPAIPSEIALDLDTYSEISPVIYLEHPSENVSGFCWENLPIFFSGVARIPSKLH